MAHIIPSPPLPFTRDQQLTQLLNDLANMQTSDHPDDARIVSIINSTRRTLEHQFRNQQAKQQDHNDPDGHIVLARLSDYYDPMTKKAQDTVLRVINFDGCCFRDPCVMPERWSDGKRVLGPESQVSERAIRWKERFRPE